MVGIVGTGGEHPTTAMAAGVAHWPLSGLVDAVVVQRVAKYLK